MNQFLSRCSSVSLSYQCLNLDTISLAMYINRKLVTINAKLTLLTLLVSIPKQAINWSMSHSYNPVNYPRHYHWAGSRLLCQPDNSDLMINVSTRTQSQLVCFKENPITLNTVIKAEFLYPLMYLRFTCYKLKLKDIITIPTSLSTSHD